MTRRRCRILYTSQHSAGLLATVRRRADVHAPTLLEPDIHRNKMTQELKTQDETRWRTLTEEASAAYENRKYTEGELKFKEALEIAERIADPEGESKATEERDDQIRVSKSLNNLASLYHVQGKYGLAEELYDRCLDLNLDLYGEETLEVAVILHNLAVVNSARRKYEKAELLYKRALEIRQSVLGENHPDLVGLLKNYALLMKKTLKLAEAALLETRAEEIESQLKKQKV